MRWPWSRRAIPLPDVDRMLDESIARLEQAVVELKQAAAQIKRTRL